MLPTLHLSPPGSAAFGISTLIYGRRGHRLRECNELLAHGPLQSMGTEAGRQARWAYFARVWQVDAQWRGPLLESLRGHIGLRDLRPPPRSGQPALLWCDGTAEGQLLLRAVCALWPGTPLWVADASCLPDVAAPLGALGPQDLARLEALAQPLPRKRQADLSAQWKALTYSNALLRVLQGGQPVGVPESIFDAELLALCSPVAQLAGRVAGAHQAGAAQSCSDAFLYYRLQYLAGQGRLHLDASHSNPADWQVRSPVGQGCALPV